MSSNPEVATQVPPISAIVAMIRVADVKASAEFYRHLGFEIGNHVPQAPPMQWAWLYQPQASNWKTGANLMLVRGRGPIQNDREEPQVLFYLYARDLKGLRAELVSKGFTPGEISYPEYLPHGEFGLHDPDGYLLMIGQSYEGSP